MFYGLLTIGIYSALQTEWTAARIAVFSENRGYIFERSFFFVFQIIFFVGCCSTLESLFKKYGDGATVVASI